MKASKKPLFVTLPGRSTVARLIFVDEKSPFTYTLPAPSTSV